MKNKQTKISRKEACDIYYKRFAEFSKILDENNIQYIGAWGTLLGAYRDNGIIPWDIDIDISIPRKDYEYIIKNHRLFTNEHLKPCHYRIKNTKSRNSHLTIELRNFSYKMKHQKKYDFVIDIFPIDDCPKGLKNRIKYEKDISFLTKLRMVKYQHKSSNFFKSIILYIGKLCLLPISYNYFDKKIERIYFNSIKKNGTEPGKTNLVYVDPFFFIEKYGDFAFPFTLEDLKMNKKVKFGSTEMPIPNKCEELLEFRFGKTYMTPINDGRFPSDIEFYYDANHQ